MEIDQALNLFGYTIYDRPYRRIEIILNGSDSNGQDDVKLSILSKESTNRAFSYLIYKFLKDKTDRPYSINNAIRENLDDDNKKIFVNTLIDLHTVLEKFVGELNEQKS